VPDGVLAAFAATHQPGEVGRIVTFRTDGSQFRVAAERVIPYIGPTSYGLWPAWSPTGDVIAFLDDVRLLVVDLATGATRDITPAGTPPVAREFPPEFDRTGTWIYFTRGYLGSQNTVWRIHPDGTGAEQVSPDAEWGLEQRGSPSPDGTRIVYHTNRATSHVVVRVLDLATGDSTDVAPAASRAGAPTASGSATAAPTACA
jgi:Tol biopolymer transport system component